MNKVVVVAPHPDDETLGCGGALLNHKRRGDEVYWLIITAVTEDGSFSPEKIEKRSLEIQQVTISYGFTSVYQCGLPTTMLDTIPTATMIQKISAIFHEINPNIVYLPYGGDVHTDHHIVFNVVSSCLKWFRYPSVKRVLAYETLSETDAALNPDSNTFRPNVFMDISLSIDEKIEIMKMYSSELGVFPFPRSDEAIRGLAAVRGAASGFKAAEAFMLLKEIIE